MVSLGCALDQFCGEAGWSECDQRYVYAGIVGRDRCDGLGRTQEVIVELTTHAEAPSKAALLSRNGFMVNVRAGD